MAQGIHSTLLIDILYFMLAWSCRARGGEEAAVDVDSAVQLGELLFYKCSTTNKDYKRYLREYMLLFGGGMCLMQCLRTSGNQKQIVLAFQLIYAREKKEKILLSRQKMESSSYPIGHS